MKYISLNFCILCFITTIYLTIKYVIYLSKEELFTILVFLIHLYGIKIWSDVVSEQIDKINNEQIH